MVLVLKQVCCTKVGIRKLKPVDSFAVNLFHDKTYSASEPAGSNWIKDNAAVCNITGYNIDKIAKDKLYQSAFDLYKYKEPNKKNETTDSAHFTPD